MRAVPVDYRTCREDPCSLGPESGEVRESFEGEPVTLFTHAIDCRGSAEPSPAPTTTARAPAPGRCTCSTGPTTRASDTRIYGESGFHHDDWESEQVRLGAAGGEARASSHHGYNYEGGRDQLALRRRDHPPPGVGSRAAHLLHLGRQPRRPRERARLRALPLDARRRSPPRAPGADRRLRPRHRVRDHAPVAQASLERSGVHGHGLTARLGREPGLRFAERLEVLVLIEPLEHPRVAGQQGREQGDERSPSR